MSLICILKLLVMFTFCKNIWNELTSVMIKRVTLSLKIDLVIHWQKAPKKFQVGLNWFCLIFYYIQWVNINVILSLTLLYMLYLLIFLFEENLLKFQSSNAFIIEFPQNTKTFLAREDQWNESVRIKTYTRFKMPNSHFFHRKDEN